MITFVCWKWFQPNCRTLYTYKHVNIWASMIQRHYKKDMRLICVTDDPSNIEIETFPLWKDLATVPNPNGGHLPSCYRRLKIFSTPQQKAMDIETGSFVVSMDLDVVVLRDIAPMFDNREEYSFSGWKRVSPDIRKPAGYNGSLFMFKAGEFDYLWDTFDPVESPKRTRRAKQFGSDQGWISLHLDGRGPGWTQASGMYSYSSDVYGQKLNGNARIVSFNGKHKPWMSNVQKLNPWITRHYYK